MARFADEKMVFCVGMLRAVLLLALLAGCSDDAQCEADCAATGSIRMDFAGGEFFSAPLPNEARRTPEGRIDLAGFPNPIAVPLVDGVVSLAQRDARGFGLTSGVFFAATEPIAPASLPSLRASTEPGASVGLIGITPGAPDYLRRYPVRVRFAEDPGPYGPPNQLTLIPLQGVPLRPNSRYAAFVTRGLRSASGAALAPAPQMVELAAGERPAGLSDASFTAFREAFGPLAEAGVAREELVALTVFTTDDPGSPLLEIAAAARAEFSPALLAPASLLEEHPTFCVFEGAVDMPVFQAGDPPFASSGGGFAFGTDGRPLLQRRERARVFVTIPKLPMPAAGYPVVVMSRTGGGGDRPLIDRGVRGEPGGPALEPGSGPAREFAMEGFAGISVDGPHGGPRNVSGGDEQLLVYNFQNPLALRDNIRQSAIELALVPDLLSVTTIDVSGCPGAVAPAGARFDLEHLALMGHSMGASITPLTAAVEPRYGALLLSGAGGSFLENLIHKQKPLAVKPLAELVLGLTAQGYGLADDSAIAHLLQWTGEPADSPIYGSALVREPWTGDARHVTMMQGIVDHYIMPPIANAASLAFGLDLAGPSLDATHPELADLDSLETLLIHAGAQQIALPAGPNEHGVIAVVTQWPEDGVEDGHEAVFQTEPPKRSYRCFLRTWLAGSPVVTDGQTACP